MFKFLFSFFILISINNIYADKKFYIGLDSKKELINKLYLYKDISLASIYSKLKNDGVSLFFNEFSKNVIFNSIKIFNLKNILISKSYQKMEDEDKKKIFIETSLENENFYKNSIWNITYLFNGISWNIYHIIELDYEKDELNLISNFFVKNFSKINFNDCNIFFIDDLFNNDLNNEIKNKNFLFLKFGEKVSIKDGEEKTLNWINASGIKVNHSIEINLSDEYLKQFNEIYSPVIESWIIFKNSQNISPGLKRTIPSGNGIMFFKYGNEKLPIGNVDLKQTLQNEIVKIKLPKQSIISSDENLNISRSLSQKMFRNISNFEYNAEYVLSLKNNSNKVIDIHINLNSEKMSVLILRSNVKYNEDISKRFFWNISLAPNESKDIKYSLIINDFNNNLKKE